MSGIDEIWAANLIDRQAFSKDNNEIKYWLTVIDIFSKFVLVTPLKTKTGEEVANAFSWILNERRPSEMWVDKGREFYNKDVQKLVELNRTIKQKMFKYFYANNARKFVDVLDLLVDQYNNAIHSSMKMTRVKQVVRRRKINCGDIHSSRGLPFLGH